MYRSEAELVSENARLKMELAKRKHGGTPSREYISHATILSQIASEIPEPTVEQRMQELRRTGMYDV